MLYNADFVFLWTSYKLLKNFDCDANDLPTCFRNCNKMNLMVNVGLNRFGNCIN